MVDSTEVPEVPEQDTVSSEEERTEAGGMGWVDLPKFRGGKEKWVTAKEFVERGRHILPIMQQNNARLKAELETERRERTALQERIAGTEESVKALEEFYAEETNRRVKEVRGQVLAQLKVAKREGDVDAEVELTDQLTQLNQEAARREAAGEGSAKTGEAEPEHTEGSEKVSPEFLQWQADNADWWGVDKVRTQRAWLIAQELRVDPGNSGLLGRPFFDRVTEILDERYAGKGNGKAAASKVGGSRGGGTARSGAGRSLTAEERQACHSFASRLVGPNKLYKSMGDWEKAYLEKYILPGEKA